jgi:RimJ/RimL family protein N-acetyltransferase
MPPPFRPEPVVLTGDHVVLTPLALTHARDLALAGRDDETWIYMPRPALRSVEDAESMIRQALAETRSGNEIAFAIVDKGSGAAAGSTRYLTIEREHRSIEIGWTWIGPAWRRTPINTECKLLLLRHAFEALGAHRVTFKTDARNLRSQRAIERIGGVREGVLRWHRICWDGSLRDSVYYGIIAPEWPGVRLRLEEMLVRR